MQPLQLSVPMAAIGLLAAGLLQTGQPPPQKVSSGLTEIVDFIATGPDGRPITNLIAADVILKVDGRPREIRSLEYIELANALAGERSGPLMPPIADPFASNRLADGGRTVMIVIHHESIRPGRERPARDAAIRFLATLSTRDRVGLVTMPRGGVLVDFTRDHEQVRSALLRVTGQAPQTRGTDVSQAGRLPGVSADQIATSDRACGSRLTLNTLASMLQSMTEIDGPKTIVFVSSGVMPPTRDAPITGAPGQCELRPVYYEEVGAAANAARAHFYLVQPNDEQADSAANAFANPEASRFNSADEDLAGLRHLAGVTHGELYRLTAQHPEAVFARVASESSAYYAIGFEADAAERNGQAHRLEIRVARDGIVLKSPPQFTIAKADVAGSDLTPQKMLRTGRRFRDLPLRATAYTSRMAGQSSLKVVAAAEPMDRSVQLKSVAFGLFDAKGKLSAQSSADGKELASLPFVAALPASPGTYMLRVAAVDVNGRRGTVDYPFRAELATTGGQNGLRASGIVLGVAGNGSFTPRLQFGSEAAAVALFELYGTAPRGSEVTVRFELAGADGGPPITGGPASLRPGPEDDSRIVIGQLSIATLPPGDYVVRAALTIDGRPAATLARTLRKVSN